MKRFHVIEGQHLFWQNHEGFSRALSGLCGCTQEGFVDVIIRPSSASCNFLRLYFRIRMHQMIEIM
jgi:hypothetical protein